MTPDIFQVLVRAHNAKSTMQAYEIQQAFDIPDSTADEILQLIESGEPYRDVLDQVASILELEIAQIAYEDSAVEDEYIDRGDNDAKTIFWDAEDEEFVLESVNEFNPPEDAGGEGEEESEEAA